MPEQLVALQPEARQLAEIGVACPGLARMTPYQSLEFFAPRSSPARRAVHSISPAGQIARRLYDNGHGVVQPQPGQEPDQPTCSRRKASVRSRACRALSA